VNASAHALIAPLVTLGYRQENVYQSFRFSAVEQPARPVRQVDAVAFVEAPASWRTAALAVAQSPSGETAQQTAELTRSLGAPFLVVIEGNEASMWTYTSSGVTRLEQTEAKHWKRLLDDRKMLAPDVIRQLKAPHARENAPVSGWLFEPGVLYGIQASIQSALDELLTQFLSHFTPERIKAGQLSLQTHHELLFPLAFRLLAGKILFDRADERLSVTCVDDPHEVIAQVEALYSLPPQRLRWTKIRSAQLASAWWTLRDGLFVRNLAADDLAFVYENTLITTHTRKALGTHSTPCSVADYVVRSLRLPYGEKAAQLRVYEPFAGACVFLTATMRRFKEQLPASWSPARVHQRLVDAFRASELDPFACEIARLALILADYPHRNGWSITRENVFEPGVLETRLSECDVVLSNPPFEDFDTALNGYSLHKPVALLDAILKTRPAFVGVVMPAGFSSHKVYQRHVQAFCEAYADIEVLHLPEGIFQHATVGAEVLIAQLPQRTIGRNVQLRKSIIQRADWLRFTRSLQPSTSETAEVNPRQSPGFTALRPLRRIWDELAEHPMLGSVAELHRGLEWSGDQRDASHHVRRAGFQKGLHRAKEALSQFRVEQTTWLDTRPERLRGGAIRYPWQSPKLICNAARLSRGPWRLAAAVDVDGLHVSQQFFGVWLRESSGMDFSLMALCAILNSPLVNAFSVVHDQHRHIRLDTMKKIPLPCRPISQNIEHLIAEYTSACTAEAHPIFSSRQALAHDLLLEIDALVMDAYDLPPRLERELLRFMNNGQRPVRAEFMGYPGTGPDEAAIALKYRLSMNKDEINAAWNILSTPLPPDVAEVFDMA